VHRKPLLGHRFAPSGKRAKGARKKDLRRLPRLAANDNRAGYYLRRSGPVAYTIPFDAPNYPSSLRKSVRHGPARAQIPPPWPPAAEGATACEAARVMPSTCAPHRAWIEMQIGFGRNAVRIYQDLVEGHGLVAHGCRSNGELSVFSDA
jgi:hypothetical protein